MTDPAVGQRDAAGCILAGGLSSRMGTDKALLMLAGKPLLLYAVESLRGAGLGVSIAASRSDLSSYAPAVPDHGFGPLSGICALLSATTMEFVVFVPVDMPLLPTSLIQAMLSSARATESVVTVASVNGVTDTFPAVLRRSALATFQTELAAGRRACLSAFKAAARKAEQAISILPVELLLQAGLVADPNGFPPSLWFLNLNMPGDLARAESTLNRLHRVI